MHYFDLFGWYTSTSIAGRATLIAPANTSETTTPGELRANFTGYVWVDLPYVVPPAPQAPAPEVPTSVTRRQARQALLLAGLLDSVDPAIAAIPDTTQRRLAEIEWIDSLEFERSRPLLISLATALGLDSAALDQLFITASAL